MAEEIAASKIVITADTSQAENEVKSFSKTMEKSMDDLAERFTIANLASEAIMAGVSALSDALKQGAKDALEYERTTVAIKVALSRTGHEVDLNSKALEQQAQRYEELFGISDEMVRGLQAQAINYGRTADNVDTLIKAAQVLANVNGTDLASSFDEILQAQEKGTTRTAGLRNAISDLSAEELKNVDIAEQVIKKYGEEGVAASANTSAVAVDRLSAAWGNVFEALFKIDNQGLVVKVIDSMADGLNRISKGLDAPMWKQLLSMSAAGIAAPIVGLPMALAGAFGVSGSTEEGTAEGSLTAPASGSSTGGGALRAPPGAEKAKTTKADKKTEWGFDEDLMAEMWMDQGTKEIKARNEIAEMHRQLDEDNQKYQWDNAKREIDFLEEKNKTIEEKTFDHMAVIGDIAMSAGAQIAGAFLNSIEAMADGQDVAWDTLVKTLLRGIGRQTMALGAGLFFQGLATTVGSVGTASPIGAAQMKVGAGLFAAGTAMWGGSLVAPGGSVVGGGSGGGGSRIGGGGGGSSFAGGSVGRSSGGGTDWGPSTINVSINTGVLTARDAGREIMDAIDHSRRLGR